MTTTNTILLQEELLALIGRLEIAAVELIAAQVHLDNVSLDARGASKGPEAKARMRSLMDSGVNGASLSPGKRTRLVRA
jgi:hypothetical protein